MNESSALTTDSSYVFSGIEAFDAAQRMAKALSSSALVPQIYQGQAGLANSLIALELANRMKISPLTVMQNMTPINGRPSWSSSFLIGTVNACGRFSPLRFVFDNDDEPTSCYAEANDLASGEVLRGEKITLDMAKAEGWYDRKGSKWKTFPGQMLRYRAGAFWARVYCPEISLGITTKEEAIDVEPVEVSVVSEAPVAARVAELTEAVESPTLTAALAAIEAAALGAPMGKFLERANTLLAEEKINGNEYTRIEEAIQLRIQSARDQAVNDRGTSELAGGASTQGMEGRDQHGPADQPAVANSDGEIKAEGATAETGVSTTGQADPIPTDNSTPPPTVPAGVDPEPAADAGNVPSPPLALKRKQALFNMLKTHPNREAIIADFCIEFGVDPSKPFSQVVKTEEHAKFIENYQ